MSQQNTFRARRLSVTEQKDVSGLLNKMNVDGTPPAQRKRRVSVSPEMGEKVLEAPPFCPSWVGTYSCHGVEPGAREGQAMAKINQDRGCVTHPFAQNDRQALFCVYDGHGSQGDKCSEFVMRRVTEVLEAKLLKGVAEDKALKEAFVEVDNELRKNRDIDAELSGTTAVVMLYRQTGEKHEAWVAWVGDSRAVVSTAAKRAMDLSEDQKPDTPAEEQRIKKAGGFVSPPEPEWGGPARVWVDPDMTLPGLAMARSIGDHLVSSVGVIAEPEVRHYPDLSEFFGGFVVLASDGVWEFIESQPCVDLVAKYIGGETGSTVRRQQASPWRQLAPAGLATSAVPLLIAS